MSHALVAVSGLAVAGGRIRATGQSERHRNSDADLNTETADTPFSIRQKVIWLGCPLVAAGRHLVLLMKKPPVPLYPGASPSRVWLSERTLRSDLQ
jgi:hypothetical protein